jgi:hypothetical protein
MPQGVYACLNDVDQRDCTNLPARRFLEQISLSGPQQLRHPTRREICLNFRRLLWQCFGGMVRRRTIVLLTRRGVIAAAGSSLAAKAFLNPGNAAKSQTVSSNDGVFPLAWLQERISIEEAERRFTPMLDDRTNHLPELRKPFGFVNGRWEKLKARVQTGDEIWTFRSPPETWEDLAGKAGVALVRENKVIDAVVTVMN